MRQCKQCEIVVDRLLQIANDVSKKQRSVAHARAEADILKLAADAAFRQSQHMKLQRKTPKVKFFDEEVPSPPVVVVVPAKEAFWKASKRAVGMRPAKKRK